MNFWRFLEKCRFSKGIHGKMKSVQNLLEAHCTHSTKRHIKVTVVIRIWPLFFVKCNWPVVMSIWPKVVCMRRCRLVICIWPIIQTVHKKTKRAPRQLYRFRWLLRLKVEFSLVLHILITVVLALLSVKLKFNKVWFNWYSFALFHLKFWFFIT